MNRYRLDQLDERNERDEHGQSGFPKASEPSRPALASAKVKQEQGIVLAIVLVMIFALITAVYAFQRRAIINASVAQNRLAAAEADAIAKGGQRVAEAVVFIAHLKELAEAGGVATGLNPEDDEDDPDENPASGSLATGPGAAEIWARLGDFPLDLGGGRTLRVSVEDEGSRLNLNALVPPEAPEAEDEDDDNESESNIGLEDFEDAEQYLTEVIRYIVDGMEGTPDEKSYDEISIAQNLIDYMDPDDTARNGRSEDAYYRNQDPPYSARNGPFLSFDEIGLVEGIDERLLSEMRHYLTVHPIGSTTGINLNRAQPWVLSIVYSGISGDRELIREQTVRDIWQVRNQDKIVCEDTSSDPERCVSLNEVGNGALGEGSFYPETSLPTIPSVFRVVAEAEVAGVSRRIEAIYDTRSIVGPQVLSWKRLRGTDSP